MTLSVQESKNENKHSESVDEKKPRDRSTISFPYVSLENCIELVEAVHRVGGYECEWNQIAAQLNSSPRSGAFRQKMIASKKFGLVNYSSGQTVILTELGKRCIDEDTRKSGLADAFLHVPLFQRLYDEYGGHKLPSSDAIQNTMQKLGVALKQTNKARQTFMKSAKYAGYFDINSDRLTKPSIDPSPLASPEETRKSSAGGDHASQDLHPLISALLVQMPPTEEGWDQAQCVVWLRTLISSISMIYKNSFDELQKIKVSTGDS